MGMNRRFAPFHALQAARTMPCCAQHRVDERQGYRRGDMTEAKRLRQRPVAGGRAKEYHVAVTPEEREVLERKALVMGVTVPRYLVDVGMNRETGVSRVTVTVLNGLKLQHSGSCSNLNQLAHQANLGHFDQSGIERALVQYENTSAAIAGFLQEVQS